MIASTIRNALRPVTFTKIGAWLKAPHDRTAIRRWARNGRRESPPHALKTQLVRSLRTKFGARQLIESGTFHGSMIGAVHREFDHIISIELDARLAAAAHRQFRHLRHVEIVHGDSGDMLPAVLDNIAEPCVFWLDGHYSGPGTAKGSTETPIVRELRAIFSHRVRSHVILIDDARCFDGLGDYPHLADVKDMVEHPGNSYSFSLEDDIIRVLPRATSTNVSIGRV